MHHWPSLPEFQGAVELYTIYERPLDFPDYFVVRRWFVVSPVLLVPDHVPRIATTLEEARLYIPEDLVHRLRRRGDDPFIVENWLPRHVRDALLAAEALDS